MPFRRGCHRSPKLEHPILGSSSKTEIDADPSDFALYFRGDCRGGPVEGVAEATGLNESQIILQSPEIIVKVFPLQRPLRRETPFQAPAYSPPRHCGRLRNQ